MNEDAAQLDDVIAWAWDGPPPGSTADVQARRLLLDSLGCALAGLRHPRVAAFAAAARRRGRARARRRGHAAGGGDALGRGE
jgi:2-methylcitrate dehydratase PrpD